MEDEKSSTILKPVSPYQALMISSEGRKALVISDVHLGWEAILSDEGIHIPSQTNKLLRRLEHIIALEKPDELIILGDVKHTVEKIEIEEWRDVPAFFEKLYGKIRRIKVVPGNHDGNIEVLLPSWVEIAPQHGMIFGKVGLFHGHAWPDLKLLECETLVIGHVHPTVTFKDQMGFHITSQVWVKAPCDKTTLVKSVLRRNRVTFRGENPERVLKERFSIEVKVKNLIVMPSFNDFLGGRAVNKTSTFNGALFKDFIGPILRSGGFLLKKAEIYLLDGTFIGVLGKIGIFNYEI